MVLDSYFKLTYKSYLIHVLYDNTIFLSVGSDLLFLDHPVCWWVECAKWQRTELM